MNYIECICRGLNQDCNKCGGRGFLPDVDIKETLIQSEQDLKKNTVARLVEAAARIPPAALESITNGVSIASMYFSCTNEELEDLQKRIQEVFNSLHYYRLCHQLLEEHTNLFSHNAWHMRLSKIRFTEPSSISKTKTYSEQIKSQILHAHKIAEATDLSQIQPIGTYHETRFNRFWIQLFPQFEFKDDFLLSNTPKALKAFFETFNTRLEKIKYEWLLKRRIIGKKKLKYDIPLIRRKLISTFLNKHLTKECFNLLYQKFELSKSGSK